MLLARARMEWEAFPERFKRVHLYYTCKKGMDIMPSNLIVDPVSFRRNGDSKYLQNMIAWATVKMEHKKNNGLRHEPAPWCPT